MHEHEEKYTSEIEQMWADPNSLLNRWANDPNPVSVSGVTNSDGKKIEIVKIPEEEREKYLLEKLGKGDK